jgi:hypothetical protein
MNLAFKRLQNDSLQNSNLLKARFNLKNYLVFQYRINDIEHIFNTDINNTIRHANIHSIL